MVTPPYLALGCGVCGKEISGEHVCGFDVDDCFDPPDKPAPGDPIYLTLLDELRTLHLDKSSSYGTPSDPLANFGAVAVAAGQHPCRYPFERIVEKATRAIHLIDAGRVAEVEECLDVAGLALCAESLRRSVV